MVGTLLMMSLYFYIGLFFLALYMYFDEKTVRVEWVSIAKFIGFISLVTCFRIAMFSFLMENGGSETLNQHIDNNFIKIPVWRLILVFWEDAFFVLPLVFCRKYIHPKLWILLFIFSSFSFGLGHIYQGISAVFVTALYPYLVSYRYGMKYGFGTIMICHILYDFITYYIAKFLPFLA